MKFFILSLTFLLSFFQLKSQTIIMNEVSNGPTGNQEYVEFVVVSNTVTYNCANTTPPCIDIRGWIFDDNSGLHGGATGTGVAPGAIRFSQNSIWSCVPLGTIILIYNNLDRNPAIPADDITMADGNCRIIAPVNNATLFETNTTTPGAVACSYPTTGWTAVGSWTTTLLANPGDCARIVNLAGCEVFSVCYGTANTNNLIYFSGNGGQTVYYFNDINPANQANWTSGSASVSPGDQTPGAPNNAANAAYIAQFNNGCMPITPIAIGTATTVNSGCLCDGSATVNASGSIGGYTYVWYDSNSLPIGQTSATATGLCAGVYKVVSTSFIGCKDSTNVTIASSGVTPSVTINNQTVCAGSSATLTATPSIAGGTYLWSPGGQTTQTISVSPTNTATYSVSYSLTGCSATNSTVVSVITTPSVSVASTSQSICPTGQTVTLSLIGTSGAYLWSNGATTATTSVANAGVYSVTVTTSCGQATSSIAITAINVDAIISANPTSGVKPVVVNFVNNSTGATTYLWDFGNGNSSLTQTVSSQTYSVPGIYTVYLTASNGSCSDMDFVIIRVLNEEPVLVVPNVFTPNNDSVNDVFKVSGSNIIEFNCTVFNRWGLKLYSWNDINKGWDGKTNGKNETDGTYFYVINAKDINDKEIKKQGYFQLFNK